MPPLAPKPGRPVEGIFRMHRSALLIVTAVVEVGAGLGLLLLPAVLFDLLIGVERPAPEALFVGRVAGAALLALGVASWLGRSAPAPRGLIAGLLVYNATVAGLLVYARAGLDMAGLALWPVVVLHAAMAAWCLACLGTKQPPA
jgi:hypothetical protein